MSPSHAPRFCREPGCSVLIRGRGSRCEAHRRETSRGYNAGRRPQDHSYYGSRAWKALRRDHLDLEPWCRWCREAGRIIPAVVVDHIVPRTEGGADDHANLRSLCRECDGRTMLRGAARRDQATNSSRSGGEGGGEGRSKS